jgi:hypothetical protein
VTSQGHPIVPWRWLRPELEGDLISLLREYGLGFDGYRRICAGLGDACNLFRDTRVSIDWADEIIRHVHPRPGPYPNYFRNFNFRTVQNELICSALHRPDVSVEMLDHILAQLNRQEVPTEMQNKIAKLAFNSGKLDVIAWALERGFVPSSRTLTRILRLYGDRNYLLKTF